MEVFHVLILAVCSTSLLFAVTALIFRLNRSWRESVATINLQANVAYLLIFVVATYALQGGGGDGSDSIAVGCPVLLRATGGASSRSMSKQSSLAPDSPEVRHHSSWSLLPTALFGSVWKAAGSGFKSTRKAVDWFVRGILPSLFGHADWVCHQLVLAYVLYRVANYLWEQAGPYAERAVESTKDAVSSVQKSAAASLPSSKSVASSKASSPRSSRSAWFLQLPKEEKPGILVRIRNSVKRMFLS